MCVSNENFLVIAANSIKNVRIDVNCLGTVSYSGRFGSSKHVPDNRGDCTSPRQQDKAPAADQEIQGVWDRSRQNHYDYAQGAFFLLGLRGTNEPNDATW
jgi:hypothetical protein